MFHLFCARLVDLLHIFIHSRDLQRWFEEPIVRKLTTDTEAQTIVMKEFEKLQEDRIALRSIFPSGNARVGNQITHAHVHTHTHTCTHMHTHTCTHTCTHTHTHAHTCTHIHTHFHAKQL